MKTAHATIALSFAALLAVGTSAMAVELQPTTTQRADPSLDAQTDMTGFRTFGFAIDTAGNTPEAVQTFISGLTPDQQNAVSVGCADVLSDAQMATNTTVVSFCKNAAL